MMRNGMTILSIAVLLVTVQGRGPASDAHAADALLGAPTTPAPKDALNRPGGPVRAPNGIDVNGKPAGPGRPAGPANAAGNDSRVNIWQDTPAKTGLGNAEGPANVDGAGLGVGGSGRRAESDPGPASAAGSGIGTGKPGPPETH